MIRDVWDWLHRQFLGNSPLGTPGNPEILEPGEAPASKRLKPRGRLRLLFTLLTAMLVVSAPAIFTIWSCLWLIEIGASHEGAAFAWLLLILFAPLTLVFTAGALVIDLFLLLAILATLSGRGAIVMNFRNMGSPGRGGGMREARRPREYANGPFGEIRSSNLEP